MRNNPFRVLLILAVLGITSITATGNEASIPKHLELGRLLLSHLEPEDTSYRHRGTVMWEGEALSTRYQAHTDCSGLINALLQRAHHPTLDRLKHAARRAPRAKDYYELIARQEGFKRIDVLTEVLPGDIIAVKYLPGHGPANDRSTGHVMLVDVKPTIRDRNTRPVVPDTKQWEVVVIDSSKSPHGKKDSRRNADGSARTGVGRGTLRLYSDVQGKLVGFSWSTVATSIFHNARTRPVVIGRPVSDLRQ